MILKQDTVTTLLNLYNRIPKGLIGWVVHSHGLANSGFTVDASVFPGGRTAHWFCTCVTLPCMNGSRCIS